jgi:hypothetical protein
MAEKVRYNSNRGCGGLTPVGPNSQRPGSRGLTHPRTRWDRRSELPGDHRCQTTEPPTRSSPTVSARRPVVASASWPSASCCWKHNPLSARGERGLGGAARRSSRPDQDAAGHAVAVTETETASRNRRLPAPGRGDFLAGMTASDRLPARTSPSQCRRPAARRGTVPSRTFMKTQPVPASTGCGSLAPWLWPIQRP